MNNGESYMKAYRIYSGKKQDALELIEHPVANPTAREIRVRMRAVSLKGSGREGVRPGIME